MNKSMQIMGIVNVTPDSFYDGGLYNTTGSAIKHAEQLVSQGADLLDIGGESTRPGAKEIGTQEEIDRVCPVIEGLKHCGIPLSIDTTKSVVAKAAIKAGAVIINDISGLSYDQDIAAIAAQYQTKLILMHIKGTPATMQDNPNYDNLLEDIYRFLDNASSIAKQHGVLSENIIVDPGIGFGKTIDDNYTIINNLQYFTKLGYQLLIGLSRKSLIGKIYSDETSDRLPATIALNTVAWLNGANIIRVHDVIEHKLALESIKMLKRVS